jgi:hypothetical protein
MREAQRSHEGTRSSSLKEQILTLERTDDLHSLRDKILRTQANRLLLLWPALDEPLTRKLDIVLMRRWAGMMGSDLAIVSADPQILKLAARAGILCYANLTVAALAAISAREEPPPRKIELRPAGRRPSPPKTQSRKRLPLHVRLPLFLAAVLLPLLTVLLSLPASKIRATFPAHTLSASIMLSPSACLPLSLDVEASDRRTTTGRILVPVAYAEGTVLFRNTSDHTLNMPVGLRITSGTGIAFLTTTGFVLPPNGTRTAKIRAVEPGSESNLPAGALTILEGQPSLSLAMNNPEPTTGGASMWRSAVSKNDLDFLRSSLTEKIKAAGEAGMLDLAGSTMTLTKDSLQYLNDPNDLPEFVDHTAADTVGLTLHTRATGLACPNEILSREAKIALDSELQPGEMLFPGSIAFAVQSISSGQVMLLASGKAAQIPAARELLPALRLLTPAAAQTLLQAKYHAVGAASVEIQPGWFPVLPLFPFRMELLLEAG